MSELTVGYLPWWPENPYQILLKQALNKHGIRIIGNPPLSLLRLLIGRDGLDVIHVHWPHGTYKTLPQFIHVLVMLIAYRLLKNNIVWTVHELDAYESRHPRRDAWFRAVVMGLCRRLIVHGEYTRQVLLTQYKFDRPIDVARHASYLGWYADAISRERARSKLGIADDAKVYLYFGYIKPYKGVEELIEVFSRFEHPNAILLIVGKPLDETIRQKVEACARVDARIRTFLHYIADDEIQVYFRAADIVVFPFKETQTSGSLMLALSFGCPVIVPAIATLPEYVRQDMGILFDPALPGDLARAMAQSAHSPLADMAHAAKLQAQSFTWEDMARVHLACYRAIGAPA